MYLYVYLMDEMYFDGKPIIIKVHAIKRAREREIAFPNQVYNVIKTGKIERFGKNHLKFIKKGKKRFNNLYWRRLRQYNNN